MKIRILQFAISILLLCLVTKAIAQFPLFIPDTLSGNLLSLTIKDSVKQFYSGYNTITIGYNGSYLGPTIILNKGQNITFNVFNQLSDTTTTHWHGLHVSPMDDGGPHTEILPLSTWSPSFTVMNNAATYWYHPHTHMKTFQQIVQGAAGLIIVRDSAESALILPRTYGVDDVPLIFQFKTMDSVTKQIDLADSLDNVVMVNGVINAYVNSPAQIVRYRILNASSARAFRFGFNDNRTFYQITSDNGLLDAPVPLTRLTLGVGERAEILVDLSGDLGDTIYLNTFSNELGTGFHGGPSPPAGNPIGPLDDTILIVLQINVTSATVNPVTAIPAVLTSNVVWSSTGVPTRNFTLDGHGVFFINATPYDPNVNNFTTQKDNIEIWEIVNSTDAAHPFHIHGNHFYILTRNSAAPPANEQGRKDVVLLAPQDTIRLITKYETFCDTTMPYMYHCHTLKHEDMGMMGQFIVECASTGIADIHLVNSDVSVYPNPGDGRFTITSSRQLSGKLIITDFLGREMYMQIVSGLPASVDVSNFPSCLYFLRLESGDARLVQKILIQK